MVSYIIIGVYLFCLSFVLLYSFAELNLTYLYLKSKKTAKNQKLLAPENWPLVCIQLPIYNEKFVVERLLGAIANLDYDKSKMQIQVLDDSNDETLAIVREKINGLKMQGFEIEHILRNDRKDFKAGALQYGLNITKADFIAIFDADFVPNPNFLKEVIPHFNQPNIGMVQSRWGHLNDKFSILTRLQSYVLNAHFTIDQAGRNFGEHFINFNGTAGVWRRETIINSGGWQGDTLTEDLDLSYRAQLKGWQFVYLENLVSPAELPAEMNALRSQQFRWAKGAAECARKNLSNVLREPKIKLSTKYNAVFHLLNSFNWICLMVSSFLLLPFTQIVDQNQNLSSLLGFMSIYHISFIALFFYYFVANKSIALKSKNDVLEFILSYPVFISLMMGLSIYNAIGVAQGYFGKKTSFVRTPKFNFSNHKKSFKGFSYVSYKFTFVGFIELLSIIYFLATTYFLFVQKNYVGLSFSIFMTAGLIAVFALSIKHSITSRT